MQKKSGGRRGGIGARGPRKGAKRPGQVGAGPGRRAPRPAPGDRPDPERRRPARGTRPDGDERAGRKGAERVPAERERADRTPADRKPAGRKPEDRKPAGRTPAGRKPADRKPADRDAGATDRRPAERRPADRRHGDRRQAPPPPPRPKKRDEPAALPAGPARTGTVAIVGRPNVGKSTLLNAALEMPLAIVSPTPQTTRDALLGVVRHGTAEIGLLDTPGLFAGKSALDRVMLRAASDAAEGADVVVFVTSVAPTAGRTDDALRPHPGDVALLRGLPPDAQVIVVLNKIDLVRDKQRMLPLLAQLAAIRPTAAVVPVSALQEDGVRRVLDEVAKLLPEGAHRHGEDDVTDRPARFFAREYVREQILLATREEVPHAVAICVDGWEEASGKRAARVSATIHVERQGQKKILVGAGGEMLTRIGSRARARLAELIGAPVHLELFVRVTEGWREKPGTLRDLGYGGDAEGEGGGSTMFVAELPAAGEPDDGGAAASGPENER